MLQVIDSINFCQTWKKNQKAKTYSQPHHKLRPKHNTLQEIYPEDISNRIVTSIILIILL